MTSKPRELDVTSCTATEHGPALCQHCDDHEHRWISLQNPFAAEQCEDLATVLDSYRWTASVLSRLALALAKELDAERHRHSCHRDNPDDARTLCGFSLGLGRLTWANLDHLVDDGGTATSPQLVITFPDSRLSHYKRRVQKALADIAKCDKWQPSHAEQAAWRYTPDPLAATPEPDTHTRDHQEQYR